MTSLDNFNENATTLTFTSPRSRESCKLQGINPSDLLKRDVAFFQEKFKVESGLKGTAHFAERACEHYEYKRQERLELVTKKREELKHKADVHHVSPAEIEEDEQLRALQELEIENRRLRAGRDRQTRDFFNLLEGEVNKNVINEQNELDKARREEAARSLAVAKVHQRHRMNEHREMLERERERQADEVEIALAANIRKEQLARDEREKKQANDRREQNLRITRRDNERREFMNKRREKAFAEKTMYQRKKDEEFAQDRFRRHNKAQQEKQARVNTIRKFYLEAEDQRHREEQEFFQELQESKERAREREQAETEALERKRQADEERDAQIAQLRNTSNTRLQASVEFRANAKRENEERIQLLFAREAETNERLANMERRRAKELEGKKALARTRRMKVEEAQAAHKKSLDEKTQELQDRIKMFEERRALEKNRSQDDIITEMLLRDDRNAHWQRMSRMKEYQTQLTKQRMNVDDVKHRKKVLVREQLKKQKKELRDLDRKERERLTYEFESLKTKINHRGVTDIMDADLGSFASAMSATSYRGEDSDEDIVDDDDDDNDDDVGNGDDRNDKDDIGGRKSRSQPVSPTNDQYDKYKTQKSGVEKVIPKTQIDGKNAMFWLTNLDQYELKGNKKTKAKSLSMYTRGSAKQRTFAKSWNGTKATSTTKLKRPIPKKLLPSPAMIPGRRRRNGRRMGASASEPVLRPMSRPSPGRGRRRRGGSRGESRGGIEQGGSSTNHDLDFLAHAQTLELEDLKKKQKAVFDKLQQNHNNANVRRMEELQKQPPGPAKRSLQARLKNEEQSTQRILDTIAREHERTIRIRQQQLDETNKLVENAAGLFETPIGKEDIETMVAVMGTMSAVSYAFARASREGQTYTNAKHFLSKHANHA